jgi:hypothetical protein
MILVVACELERPEVTFHGLFAARLIFLSLEGSLVGGDFDQKVYIYIVYI